VSTKKLAQRASRLIKKFWIKIDRVIAHKQRLAWQASQRAAMDMHLLELIRQTEQYTGDLAERMHSGALMSLETSKSNSASCFDRLVTSKKIVPPQRSQSEPINICTSEKSSSLIAQLEAADMRARKAEVTRPYLLDSTVMLRPYQQIGLNWLVSMHERRLNGILADEMGLGKTLQTIALLAHLAACKGLWGPHLVVVPTSCLVNWELELKKFCPSLKVLTYYGAAKARKQLRVGWSKSLSVHVVVTSYQLAVQDASILRRKKFYYLILDEAHNIKNFDSRRWRTLLSFQAQRRLLLTGTPLQNSLMELWSLMHFLMPNLFRSRHEFSYWFANPLQCAIEGNSNISEDLVKQLHSIMRPFVLRRLKKDVAKQLPLKFEHELKCQLSRRQQLLYEEFMNHSKSRRVASGKYGICSSSFVSLMNIVMQLRKVCNHPDLCEPRSVLAPLVLPSLSFRVPLMLSGLTCLPGISYGVDDARCTSCTTTLPASASLILSQNYLVSCKHPSQCSSNLPMSSHTSTGKIIVKDTIAVMLRHTARCARTLDATLPSHISSCTRHFILQVFESSTPLALAWQSLIHPNDSRLQSNRQSLKASDALRRHLEHQAAVNARYWNLFELLKRFAFVVPAALASAPFLSGSRFTFREQNEVHGVSTELTAKVTAAFLPIRHITLALRVSFPDRTLLQWDSGKFHELAPLLRRLKIQEHRCLIFTQMSKMLDVLQGFLCWHGHSYLRLDGSTSPDERQRLMTRFNSDTAVFCFLLSTRSGGLGINLTGADTVIFYDSDWNPAMDAQAMDRAHRIGQTRDVHIYRLVCISTIEENILLKARQKQKLELITLTEGNFCSQQLHVEEDLFSDQSKVPATEENAKLAVTMAELEDDIDAKHAREAAAEAAAESREFDEPCSEIGADDRAAFGAGAVGRGSETVPWREQIGMDIGTLTRSLNAIERYAIFIREAQSSTIPSVPAEESAFVVPAERRLVATKRRKNGEGGADAKTIEGLQQIEERRACSDGELSATDLYFIPTTIAGALSSVPENSNRREFLKRRQLALSAKRKRKCTGAAWEARTDAITGSPFWYNVDTAEATWMKPFVIQRRDARRGN